METIITANDIKGLIRRRAKTFVLLFCLIVFSTIIVAVSLPPVYRSEATIQIEAQQIPDEYVKSSITSYAEQRLSMITREILRFGALKEVIKEFQLYPDHLKNKDIGLAVQEMKESIAIEPISSKVGHQSYTVAFILSYEGDSPQKTFSVVDRLSKRCLELETSERKESAESTTRFLEKQLSNIKQQIQMHERKISEFKQRHIDQLPGSAPANIATLERLEREADQVTNRIRSLEDRKIYLKGELSKTQPLKPVRTESGVVAGNPYERLKSLNLGLLSARSRLSPKHPDIRKMINEIGELEKQIGQADETVVKVKHLQTLRTNLDQSRAVKGDKHPDVINLNKEVNELAKEVDVLLSKNVAEELSKQKPDNPAYIHLRTQIVSADLEIKNLKLDIENINETVQKYQGRVELAPIVEQEYKQLTLDYENARKRYNEISGQLLKARIAQEMDLQQHGEHFSIADEAYLPSRPSKPNRLAMMLLGFVFATGAGLGGAALKEALDHTIKSSNEIAQFEGVDLLTVMPYTPTSEEIRQKWFKRLVLSSVCLGIMGIALVIVDKLVWPLSSIVSIVVERLAY